MNQQLLNTMFDLIKFDLFGEVNFNDDTKEYINNNIKTIYALSKRHDIAHIIADAVEKLGIELSDENVAAKLKRLLFVSVVRYERINHELVRVCDAFENNGIYHMPLKGVILRKLYPKPWLRTSCDIDILVNESDVEKAMKLLSDMGYGEGKKTGHDVSMVSEGGVNVELHYKLVEDGRVNSTNEVLKKVWDYSTVTEGKKFCLEMQKEMVYFYHIAHMAKHFEVGGCGIKPFIDQLIMKRTGYYKVGEENELLMKGGLLKFEGKVCQICSIWFENMEHSDITRRMQKYLINGGTYGNIGNHTSVESFKKGGKLKYILCLIWLPYDALCLKYPSLKNKKWLYPFYQVRRWIGVVPKLKKHILIFKTINSKKNDELDSMGTFFNDIGLDL